MNDKVQTRTRSGERTSLRIALVVALATAAGCANQTPVTPLLRVDPNAASRFMYFEKRAASMLKEHGVVPEQVDESLDEALAESIDYEATTDDYRPPLRTWGAPSDAEPPQGAASSGAAAPSPPLPPKQKDLAIP